MEAKVKIEGRALRLTDGDRTLYPLAEEIFAVVFEAADNIRGVPVSARDFESTGVVFSPNPAVPLLLLTTHPSGPRGPEILCDLFVSTGAGEHPVGRDGDTLLDHAVCDGHWMPLPRGTLDGLGRMLKKAGIARPGTITLGQYMNLVRQTGAESIGIEDRTAATLGAADLAPRLDGEPPAGLHAKLFPYQREGYRWLSYMVREGLGAVLADEMGLGKTLQVICLLAELAERNGTACIVVAPATLLENWRREIARFAPGLRVLIHQGAGRAGLSTMLAGYNVVVTSFETAVGDIAMLRNITWDLVVVDEAQNVKNPEARRSVQLRTLPRRSTVAVTGTPVENRLRDLWSVLDFSLPGCLGSLPEFEREYPSTLEAARKLEPRVSPLLLRRLVRDVADDLPGRIDIPQQLELDEESARAYEEIRAEAVARYGKAASFVALTTLRQFCTHPWLVGRMRHITDPLRCSVKLSRLFEIMEEIIATGGKAIIFTSFLEMTDILLREIGTRLRIPVDHIDGRVGVEDRQRRVDSFGAVKGSAVLVLGPKAAGVGLNITAANHVIHYNPEWNPATEDQATARAYRRGQYEVVTVHRLLYVATIEEVMDERMTGKRALAGTVVVPTDSERDMEDILRALQVSPLDR